MCELWCYCQDESGNAKGRPSTFLGAGNLNEDPYGTYEKYKAEITKTFEVIKGKITSRKGDLPLGWEKVVADEDDTDGRYYTGDVIYHYYETEGNPVPVSDLPEDAAEKKQFLTATRPGPV